MSEGKSPAEIEILMRCIFWSLVCLASN
jgi:hypothetical protein